MSGGLSEVFMGLCVRGHRQYYCGVPGNLAHFSYVDILR